MSLTIHKFDTGVELGKTVAGKILEILDARQAEGVTPVLVLTGGSMGEASFIALGDDLDLTPVNWKKVASIWGDEGVVDSGRRERNDAQFDEFLLPHVELNEELLYRVPTSDSGIDLDEAAAEYAKTVAALPQIDIVLNGIGPDGHIASLFPNREELRV